MSAGWISINVIDTQKETVRRYELDERGRLLRPLTQVETERYVETVKKINSGFEEMKKEAKRK